MVDNFSIALSHLLLAIMLWRLFNSPALDNESGEERGGFAMTKSKPKLKPGPKDDKSGA